MTSSLGLYDSGIGGLSVLKQIRERFPKMKIQYLGDTEIMPIGERSRAEIIDRVRRATHYLFNNGCTLIILACNTASVASIRILQNELKARNETSHHNILGVNVPFMELMGERYSELRREEGVMIATSATVQSGYYQGELTKKGFISIQYIASEDLAAAIESGDKKRVTSAIMSVLKSLNKPVDSIKFVLLGSTHYPFALNTLKKYFSPDAVFIDASIAIAPKLGTYLGRHLEYQVGEGEVDYLTTADMREFAGIVRRVTGQSIDPVNVRF